MIRKSRRELARRLDDLASDIPTGDADRPEPLDADEKHALAALFDTADPQGGGTTPAYEAVAKLHRQEAER